MAASEPETKRGLVLVVDDSAASLDVLVEVLGTEFQVRAARDAASALRLAVTEPVPDLILLDVVMPEVDGYAVCERLQADPRTAAVPVVFVTGRDSVPDKVRGFAAGAVDYVTKPFDAAEVRARVRAHVELRQAREAIRRHTEELEAMLATRTRELVHTERQAAFGALVQGIVHNLRGPLAAMVMVLEELRTARKEGGDLDAALELAFRVGPRACEQVRHMLESLLTRSRIDQRGAVQPVDLNEIVRNELDFLEADPRFKHKTRKVIELAQEPLVVRCAPAELAQVVHNLVHNALDAMTQQDPALLTIETRADGGWVELVVTDTGPGIPEELHARIFDPFFTTKGSVEGGPGEQPKGTGLGLWFSQEATRAAGGEILLAKGPGMGASFRVRLPRAASVSPTVIPPRDPSP